jgi:hypothetical protein
MTGMGRRELRSLALVGTFAVAIGLGVAGVLAARPPVETAPAGARVRLIPEHSQVHFGETFTVSLQVDEPGNLAGYQADLVYAPDVVVVTGVSLGPMLSSTGRTAELLGPKSRGAGRTAIGAYSYGHASGISRPGTLAQVALRALCPGNTSLRLESLQLVDPQANLLAGEAADAQVEVSAPYEVFLPIIAKKR